MSSINGEIGEDLAHTHDAAAPTPDGSVGLRKFFASDFVQKVLETVGAQGVRIALGLITTIVVARVLGPAGRGLYAVAVAAGALGVQFSNLGLPAANVYFTARDRSAVPAILGNTLAVSLGAGTIGAAVLGIVIAARPSLLSLGPVATVLVLLWIPVGLAYLLMQNILIGLQDVRTYNVIEVASKLLPLLVIAVLVVARYCRVDYLFAATFAGVAFAAAWIFRVLTSRIGAAPTLSASVFRKSVAYAAKAYMGALFTFLVLRADLFMVKWKLGAEAAGYYSIAGVLGDTVPFLAVTIGMILFPKLSAADDVRSKLVLTRKSVVATAATMAPVLLVSVVLIRPLLTLLVGSSFLPAALPWMLLAPGIFFLCLESVAVQFLNSVGYPLEVVIMWFACSALNIGLNLVAIPRYGIAGASVVSTICYFLSFIAVLGLIRVHVARVAEA